MPNWCRCVLVLKSDNVRYLADFNRENETAGILDFKKSLPQDNIRSSKLIIPDDNKKKNKNKCIYKFDAANFPPIPWVVKISNKYDKINFKLIYGEDGSNIAGKLVFNKGCAESFQELSFSEFMWNYQINKINLIKRISTIYFSDIFNNIKVHYLSGMMLVNRFLKKDDFKEAKLLISFYIKKNLIKKYVNLKTTNSDFDIISLLFKDYEICCPKLINNTIFPNTKLDLINQLEKYIL